MRRWWLPGAFAAAALLTGIRTGHAIALAGSHPGSEWALVALYYALRTAVALAFAFFTVARAEPQKNARQPLAILSCAVAMSAVLVLTPPTAAGHMATVLAGDAIAVISCTWLLASVLSLGRCFGVLPEARGLVTRGPYRLVRHPVYLGELGAVAGLALAAPSGLNAAILAVFTAAQVVRMGFEERALAEAFPEYRAYAQRTPRLLPRIGAPPRRSRTPVTRTATAD